MNLHQAISLIPDLVEMRMKGEKNISTRYLSGKPGGGKTQSIRALAKKMNWGLLTFNISMETVERFGGIPDLIPVSSISEGEEKIEYHTVWSIPEIIITLRNMSNKYKATLCLLDDWHLAPPSICQLGYELFTDFSIRGHKIPENITFILAGNDSSAAGSKSQFSAVMNRVSKLYVETDYDYWLTEFAYKNGIDHSITSFLSLLEYRKHFHGEESMIDPWPSPRSWTNFSTELKSLKHNQYWDKLSNKDRLIIISSYVGVAAGTEYEKYYSIYSQYNVEDILNTGVYKYPEKKLEIYAFACAVCSGYYNFYKNSNDQIKTEKDKKVSDNFGKILTKICNTQSEIAVMCIRYLSTKSVKLVKSLFLNGSIPREMSKKLMSAGNVLSDET